MSAVSNSGPDPASSEAQLESSSGGESTLTVVVALAAGVMNILPWGGPTVRAMAALKAERRR